MKNTQRIQWFLLSVVAMGFIFLTERANANINPVDIIITKAECRSSNGSSLMFNRKFALHVKAEPKEFSGIYRSGSLTGYDCKALLPYYKNEIGRLQTVDIGQSEYIIKVKTKHCSGDPPSYPHFDPDCVEEYGLNKYIRYNFGIQRETVTLSKKIPFQEER